VPEALRGLLAAVGARSGLAVVRDGRPVHIEVEPSLAGRGVSAGGLAVVDDARRLLGSVVAPAEPADAFLELSDALVADAVVVRVPDKVVVDDPFVVLHWVESDRTAVFPRTFVAVGEAGQARVIEIVASPDLASLVVPVVELDVADAASLSYLGVQTLGRRVWQVAHQASRVGRDASLQTFSVGLGGDYARLRTDSRLVGQGASSRLLAAYFGDEDQTHDFRTLQEHDAPRTTSDLVFQGAVADRARSVYSGLIRVRRGAVGTNAFQTNRNLVLSEGAHADSVPNLDILENDVRCSHASTVGPIDEDQRYYLATRGVPPEAADRLIVLGFFDDILARDPIPGTRSYLRAEVSDRLTASGEGRQGW
jgi:Fe-S cluster assembly protein SufD